MLINGNKIKQDVVVDMEKDLGITFDKRLEFDYHIQEKKANSMYGMLRRTFKLSYHCIKPWLEVSWTTAV